MEREREGSRMIGVKVFDPNTWKGGVTSCKGGERSGGGVSWGRGYIRIWGLDLLILSCPIGHPHEEDKWAIAHMIWISWEKSELRAFLTHGQSL